MPPFFHYIKIISLHFYFYFFLSLPQPLQYLRIKRIDTRGSPRWRPLIPGSTNPLAIKNAERKLSQFGATYPKASQAAEAADRALIAMWGPKAAAPNLNFPLEKYPQEEQQQRFGTALSSFLLKICEESATARAEKQGERLKRGLPASWQAKERRRLQVKKIRTTRIVDETVNCGICPTCRQPWLHEVCYRKKAARTLGYKASKVAERMLDEAGGHISGLDDDSEELASANASLKDHKSTSEAANVAIETAKQEGEATILAIEKGKGKNLILGKKESPIELEWYGQPPKGSHAAPRDRHMNRIESKHIQAESTAAEEAAAEAAALTNKLDQSQLPGIVTAPPPKDFIPPPPHASLLRHAVECAALDADLALVGEDEARWALPLGQMGVGPCTMCLGFHGGTPKDCPLVQAAYAAPKAHLEEHCRHCVGVKFPNCKHCGRGVLPESVWMPAAVATPWMGKVPPATVEVMHSVQSMASAAAVDFDRPDVAGKLGPEALLAIGLLAEEVAKSQLRLSELGAGLVEPK